MTPPRLPTDRQPTGCDTPQRRSEMSIGICPCDTPEEHPVSECTVPGQSNDEVFLRDVMQLAAALGLGIHARPYSAHAVVHREILPALQALPLPECPTHAVCPNCREGWGHWNGQRYEPTEQSRAANAELSR